VSFLEFNLEPWDLRVSSAFKEPSLYSEELKGLKAVVAKSTLQVGMTICISYLHLLSLPVLAIHTWPKWIP
jgi:hypothetical protein